MASLKMGIRISLLALAAAPLLAACDDDMVAVPYHGVPYTHERTAGSGVEWVRRSMLPAKEVNTTSVTTETKTVGAPEKTEPVVAPAPAPAQQMFNKKQAK